VSRWKISDSAPVYALALIVIVFSLFFSAAIFVFQTFGNLPTTARWVLVVLVVVLCLFGLYRFRSTFEPPQSEDEVRW
jgi:membrane protein implicated in regulation of membrane protease activity